MQINAFNDFKSLYLSNISYINNYTLSNNHRQVIFNRRPPDTTPVTLVIPTGNIDIISFLEQGILIFELKIIERSISSPKTVIEIVHTFLKEGSNINMLWLNWMILRKESGGANMSYRAYRGNLIYDSWRKGLLISYAGNEDFFCNSHTDLVSPLAFRQFRQIPPALLSNYFRFFKLFRVTKKFYSPVSEEAVHKLILAPSLADPALSLRAEKDYRLCQAKCSLFDNLEPWVVDVRDDGSLVFKAGVIARY